MTKYYQILKETLKKIIADSPLDTGGAFYVLKDLYRDAEAQYYAEINHELEEEAKEAITDEQSIQQSCSVEELSEH